MCGIIGTTGTGGGFDDAYVSIRHRGPDGAGVIEQGGVHLAHRRLAIIDVSERGRQPMQNATGDIAITFNGEIYNYRELRESLEAKGAHFRTESDTEAIILGYEQEGTAFFSKMRGMWAFAIHDSKKNDIVLSRDYFGIKPLLYSTSGGILSFASEMSAMKQLLGAVSPNTDAYYQFFNLGYFTGGDTCYREVRRVLPGEIIIWHIEQKVAATERILWPVTEAEELIFDESASKIDAALRNSIEAHFVSDVPVGLLLSGGNDSSLIAALSVAAGRKPVCYTLEIDGSIDAEYARKVAEHLGLPQVRIPMTPQMFAQGYMQALDIIDEPFADSSIIPTSLIYREMRGKTKVVLSGEGGDELFGGYTRHRAFARLRDIRHRGVADATFRAYGTSQLAISKLNPALSRLRRALESYSGDLVGTYLSNVRLLDFPIAHERIRKLLVRAYASDSRTALKDPPSLFFDRALYLPNDLLYKTDMASMASSIEARVPYLDREVFAASSSIGPKYSLSREYTDKRILKRVAEKYLPKGLIYRPKKGFGFSHEIYVNDQFTQDVGRALDFHYAHAPDFGLTNERVMPLLHSSKARMVVKKFPVFAFALVTNWKVFS